jgi:membrane protein required for colicin V production
LSIDIAFLIVMLFAIFKGMAKGLILGIFSFFAFMIGLAAALKLSAVVAHHLENSTGSTAKWLPVISFALVFFVVALLVTLAAGIIKKAVSLAMLGWVDKIGGIVLYIIIYTVIFSVILFFAEKTFLIKPETIATSSVHDYVAPWGPKVINNLGKIIPVFEGLFTELQTFFEKLGNKFAV